MNIRKRNTLYDTKTMRWILCLLAALFYSYDFLLRVQPNILSNQLMNFYGINAAGVGLLFAAYYWAYTPLQIPAGLIVDRYSTRAILTISSLLCAVGAILFAGVQNFFIGFIARLLMGVGSAFAFVSALKLAALWLPTRYFAAFSGLSTSLGMLGAVVNNASITLLVVHYGWQQAVFITGYIGLGITLLLFLVVRNHPKDLKPLPHEFKNWGHAFHRLWFIAKQGVFWLNGLVGGMAFLPISVLAGMWGTTFLEVAYHFPPGQAAIADAIIFIGIAISSPTCGWLSDHIGRRKPLLYTGLIVSTLISLIVIYAPSLPKEVLYSLLFLLGLFTGPQAIVFVISKELSPPRTTGTASASTNLLVTLGGALFAPLIGALLVKFWDGTLSATGVPLYSLQTYHKALLVIPAATLLAVVLLWFVPETYCQTQHKQFVKYKQSN